MNYHSIKLDVADVGVVASGVRLKQFAYGKDVLRVFLKKNGEAYNPTEEFELCSVRFIRSDGRVNEKLIWKKNVESLAGVAAGEDGMYYCDVTYDLFCSFIAGTVGFEIIFHSPESSERIVCSRIEFEVFKSISSYNVIDQKSIDLIAHILEDMAAFKTVAEAQTYVDMLEAARVAEEERISAEKGRLLAENGRVEAEELRAKADAGREAHIAELISQAMAKLVDSAPETLDTLDELASALGDDPNFATTIMEMLGKKANISDIVETPVKSGEGEGSTILTDSDSLSFSSFGSAFGKANVVGCKGCYIKAIDYTNKKIYLSKTQVVPEDLNGEYEVSDYVDTDYPTYAYTPGNRFSLMMGAEYHFGSATISAVENNVITYAGNLPFTKVPTYSSIGEHYYILFVPKNPDVGDNIDVFKCAFSIGRDCLALNRYSFAGGRGCVSYGPYSFAYGYLCESGYGAFAIGQDTEAQGSYSLTGGTCTKTFAQAQNAFAFGLYAYARAAQAVALGLYTNAGSPNQFVCGKYNINDLKEKFAVIVGNGSQDALSNAFTLDWNGNGWFAGDVTVGEKKNKLVTEDELDIRAGEGENSAIQGHTLSNWESSDDINQNAHKYINDIVKNGNGLAIQLDDAGNVMAGAFGDGSASFGTKSQALGGKSFAEGSKTIAFENNSHAEGNGTFAAEKHSHAEGNGTTAFGNASHAEGEGTVSRGQASHAEGFWTKAQWFGSHAEGYYTITGGDNQHVQGQWNLEMGSDYLHVVGNGTGTGENPRSNAHTLKKNGNAWFAGTVETTGVILTSPGGIRYKLVVADDGTLGTEAV